MVKKIKKKKKVVADAVLPLAESEPTSGQVSAQEAAFAALLAPEKNVRTAEKEGKLRKKKKKQEAKAALAVPVVVEAVPVVADAERTPEERKRDAKKQRKRDRVADGADAGAVEGEPVRKQKTKKQPADAHAEEAAESNKSDPFKKKDSAAACAHKVCVSQLPWSVDEDLLRKDFGECGEISVIVLLHNENGQSRGIAFISFAEAEGKAAALKFNATDYWGRLIKVTPALEREDRLKWKQNNPYQGDEGKGKDKCKGKGKGKGKEKGKGKGKPSALGPKPEHCTSILVKSLSEKVVEDDLYNFFQKCGEAGPTNIRIMTSSVGKRLAFVDFDSTEAVDQAIALNSTDLKGDPAFLAYSKPREHKIRKPQEE